MLIVLFVLGFLQNSYGTVHSFGESDLNRTGWIIQIIIMLFGVFYTIGMVKIGFHCINDKDYSFGSMFVHSRKELWKYIATSILFVALIALPFVVVGGSSYALYSVSGSSSLWMTTFAFIASLLFLVFVFYIIFRIGFVLYFVVVDHADSMNPVQMVRHSWDMSKGNVLKLFGTLFVAGLINILGVLALGVGLLWTIPLAQIAMAKLYKDMDDTYHKKNQDALEA